ncbi:pyroglutamyl-peptidase I [Peribacillus sp. SCS-37]|uniref:pyroglutamyl-peptidase I n=1 Tax=Paraperibacillus esterisolvens TaxID=3115296 RepID=UPI003906D0BD
MKTLMLTGFEPFLEFPINPTFEIVNELNGEKIGNYHVTGKVLPVDFEQTGIRARQYFDEVSPDVVISLGLAAGRNRITPERIAINCSDGPKDNRGVSPEDQPIVEDGQDGYFTTLPIRKFVQVLEENGYPAEISNTAGTYLCNNVMYNVLHKISSENKNCRAGFIHMPASHQLALKTPNLPSWSQKDLVESIRLIISSLD